MNINELKLLQNYPLELKVAKTKLRIEEWVNHFGTDGVCVAFSGGKDSTVLLHLVRSLYPEIPAVFANTGNEFPEIVQFVRSTENVVWVKPRKSFSRLLKEEGYPVVSKMQAGMLRKLQNPSEKNAKSRKLYLSDFTLDADGNPTDTPNRLFKLANKHRYLIDAPFPISEKCCDYLKKYPMKDYQKETGRVPFVGTMASESRMREQQYLKNGCNAFRDKDPKSTPIGFWTEQDVLEYIFVNNLKIADIYGEVKQREDGTFYTTGENRTGCVACGFGVHLEGNEDNRYLRLEQTHPKLHNHIINNLGFGNVLDYMNIKHSKNKEVDNEQLSLLD